MLEEDDKAEALGPGCVEGVAVDDLGVDLFHLVQDWMCH